MKGFKGWIQWILIMILVAIAPPGNTQTGNQSDVTGPQPVELPPAPPIEPAGEITPLPIVPDTSGETPAETPAEIPPAEEIPGDSPPVTEEPAAETPIDTPIDTPPTEEPIPPLDTPPELPDPVQIVDPSDPLIPDVIPDTVIPENPELPVVEEIPPPVRENNPEPGRSNPIETQILEDIPNTMGDTQPNLQSQQEVDRPAYESQLAVSDVSVAVQMLEEYHALEFGNYLEVELFGETATPDEIAQALYDLWEATGSKSAFIYVSALADQLELIIIFPQNFRVTSSHDQWLASTTLSQGLIERSEDIAIRQTVPNVSREALLSQVEQLRSELTNPRKLNTKSYLPMAQQLYQWAIAPMEALLQEQGIDTLVFSMDSGLRTLPLATLHDGEQFLLEKYAVALVPSFGLTDVTYSDLRSGEVLGMGSSIFNNLNPLPAVPTELESIVSYPWVGNVFLNEGFTANNFRQINQEKRFGIIHLATHAEFQGGNLEKSYIQFYDSRMGLNQIRDLANELGWQTAENPPIELLTLSACRTAVGDLQAELGFAGLAVLSGAKASLASFWYVSDAGTLGLMTEFYSQLAENPLKAQALRETQLALLNGEVKIENGMLLLSNGKAIALPPELAVQGDFILSHPYFWSAFTMIGNWN